MLGREDIYAGRPEILKDMGVFMQNTNGVLSILGKSRHLPEFQDMV